MSPGLDKREMNFPPPTPTFFPLSPPKKRGKNAIINLLHLYPTASPSSPGETLVFKTQKDLPPFSLPLSLFFSLSLSHPPRFFLFFSLSLSLFLSPFLSVSDDGPLLNLCSCLKSELQAGRGSVIVGKGCRV